MKSYVIKVKCPVCGEYMILDEIDADFKGNQIEYWVCPTCASIAFVIVRYSKVCRIYYTDNEGLPIKISENKHY